MLRSSDEDPDDFAKKDDDLEEESKKGVGSPSSAVVGCGRLSAEEVRLADSLAAAALSEAWPHGKNRALKAWAARMLVGGRLASDFICIANFQEVLPVWGKVHNSKSGMDPSRYIKRLLD